MKLRLKKQIELDVYKKYGYLSYNDIRGIQAFKKETILAIKAPPSTQLHVPNPEEQEVCVSIVMILIFDFDFFPFFFAKQGPKKYEIFLLSDKGPIDVFLVDGDAATLGQKTTSSIGTDPSSSTPGKPGGVAAPPSTPFAVPATPKRLDAIIDQTMASRSAENDPSLHSVNSFMTPGSSAVFLQPGSGGNSSDAFLSLGNQAQTPNTSFGSIFKLDDSKPRDLDSPSPKSSLFYKGSGVAGTAGASKSRSPLPLGEQESPSFGKTHSLEQPFTPYVFGMAETEGIADIYGEENFGNQSQ